MKKPKNYNSEKDTLLCVKRGCANIQGEGEYCREHEEIDNKLVKNRLEYLRAEIRAECISQGEINELQSLAKYIEPGDVELLEWAGVPEFEEEENEDEHNQEVKEQISKARFGIIK